MATTTMLYDLAEDDWSSELMDAFDVPSKFPEPVLDPGAVVGSVTQEAAAASGVAQGTPVCAGGHDTVIAAAGACRDLRETLLYSTGTWNIFIATRDHLGVRASDRRRNVLWQLNPHRSGVLGGYNVQGHMIGGLAFDMVRRMFLPNESAAGATERATHVPPGSHGVAMNPTFVAGTGPNPNAPSAILGWEDGLAPECAVRSVLEGLAFQARDSMECLRSDAEAILVGGGFAKNRLFAQILADVTGRAVELAGIPEVTTLGAAVLAMVGASVVDSVEEAWTRIGTPVTTFEPSGADTYAPLYEQHRRSVEALDREGS
jgi:xylulokinase